MNDFLTPLERARNNEKRKQACTGHMFKRTGAYGQHRCIHCGCTADSTFVAGYLQGISHSRVNPVASNQGRVWRGKAYG